MKSFSKIFIVIAVFIMLFPLDVKASEEERLKCINNLRLAFELQSHAKTYLDSYSNCVLFNGAEAQLKKLGEPKHRLKAVHNLWLWYRMYGYSMGLLENPVQSPDEYIPRWKSFDMSKDNHGMDYNQQRWVRDFLTGVGLTISGIFCLTVGSQVMGKFGVSLVMTGGGYMYNSINNIMVDYQEKQARLQELSALQKQAEKSAQRKRNKKIIIK